MKGTKPHNFISATFVCLCIITQLIYAQIITTGDVSPANPATWTSSTWAYIGRNADGSMTINQKSQVKSYQSYIGRDSGVNGKVTVDGAGATWNNSDDSYIGYSGNGTLNIINGGQVTSGHSVIGFRGTGHVTVEGTNSIWSSTGIDIGGINDGIGTLNIINGGRVSSGSGFIGFSAGATGEVNINGTDSTWFCQGPIYVGHLDTNGSLNITDGGMVTAQGTTWVSFTPDSDGTIHMDNGTLTTGGFCGGADDLAGTGTINTHGLVSDVDLVFDATHGMNQTLTINNNIDQNITINLDVDGSRAMGAGYGGTGTMRIAEGITMESINGYIGYNAGSQGTVTVDGTDSAWNAGTYMRIGHHGEGTLNIINGGQVRNSMAHLGEDTDAIGHVTVDGPGSTWTNDNQLEIREGTLDITHGGKVSNSIWNQIGLSGPGIATVDGIDSTLINNGDVYVGLTNQGILNIKNNGLVSIAETLTIDYDNNGDSFINISSGGMLALFGKADGSLVDFLDLIEGTDAIRFWDESIMDWNHISNAIYGQDYTLDYITEGDLNGYTILTVPEPGTVLLLGIGGLFLRKKW